MHHLLVFAAILLVLVVLLLVLDRHEITRRAAGTMRFDPALAWCALLLLASAAYTVIVLWNNNPLLALMAGLAAPPLLTFASIFIRFLLQEAAPAWFPEPPPVCPPSSPTARAALNPPVPVLTPAAFGRPAQAFESVGTWLSNCGNCRNTAWSPAGGPSAPRLAWQWNVAPSAPEYLFSIYGAPAVDHGGRAYLATSHGLVALDQDGKRLWVLGETRAGTPALDLAGNVVSACKDRLLIATPAGKASWLDCPDLSAGDVAAVTVADDGAIFVTGLGSADLDSGRLAALDSSGSLRWRARCLRHVDYPPAISSAGKAYLSSHDSIVWNPDDPSSGYDRFQAFSAEGAEIDRVDANDEGYGSVWSATAAMCLEDGMPAVGIGDGIRIGSALFEHRGWGTLAIDPVGTLYVAGQGLTAIDLANGRQKWSVEAGGVPVVDGEGTVYIGGRGRVTAVSADGETLWSWELPDAQTGKSILGLAIGPGRTLYAATEQVLYALRA